jgi:acyl dehydratase
MLQSAERAQRPAHPGPDNPAARVPDHASCFVRRDQITGYRDVVLSAASNETKQNRADVASPIQPFVLAWSTFDTAVGILTGLPAPTVVHLSQEIRQHRPLRPDDNIVLGLEVLGARREPRGARISFLSVLHDAHGGAVAELVTGLLAVGATNPPSFGDPARHPSSGNHEWTIEVPALIPTWLPAAYARISDDANPIHLDDGAARAAGLPGIVAHGMSVVALVAEEAIARFADGDAARIAGIGTRFSAPVFPGVPFTISFHTEGRGRIHFACRTDHGLALKNGWVDVHR